ncbi:MAG: hypothetical protein WC295_01505 [Methanoregula sp.]
MTDSAYPGVCPNWCSYACIDAWQSGDCLIRTPEKNEELRTAYERGEPPEHIIDRATGLHELSELAYGRLADIGILTPAGTLAGGGDSLQVDNPPHLPLSVHRRTSCQGGPVHHLILTGPDSWYPATREPRTAAVRIDTVAHTAELVFPSPEQSGQPVDRQQRRDAAYAFLWWTEDLIHQGFHTAGAEHDHQGDPA